MPPEETVSKSPLDKPLQQLTEDDISQLTREDCRRYLKQKGMRRPSWNKSQAIQQVISLKTLLETTTDSDAASARKKLLVPRPIRDNVNNNRNYSPRHSVPRGTSMDADFSESPEETETVPSHTKDADTPDVSGHAAAAENDSNSPRTTGSAKMSAGQMTIFYCGKVNVYDDVPTDKAHAIMHLAASPLHLPQEAPLDCSLSVQPACLLKAPSVKVGPESVKMSENTRLHGEECKFPDDSPAMEGPASRKASVQRYLEKRKDRFKSKKKVGMTSSNSLDVYLNHQMGNETTNEHSSRSETCSPPHSRPLNTPIRSSSMENSITKNANFSAPHNDKDIKE